MKKKRIIKKEIKKRRKKMNFAKGVMVGTLVSAGIMLMYNETMNKESKKIVKRGKKFIKQMGL